MIMKMVDWPDLDGDTRVSSRGIYVRRQHGDTTDGYQVLWREDLNPMTRLIFA